MSTEPAFGACAPTPTQRRLIHSAHKSFLKRGTFRPFMARTLEAIRKGPLDLHFMDIPFRLRPLRSSADLGMTFNPDYNGKEIRFLLAAIPQGGLFVDIGCNIGMYSLPIAKQIAPKGRVIGIEPHPEALGYLAFNLQNANLTNFTLIECAVGDFTGEAVIETNLRNLGASQIKADGNTIIPIRPLLDVLNEQNVQRIDALKIDIEGYEDRALLPFFQNASQSLWPKVISIEHLSHRVWQSDIITALKHYGYEATGRTRSNLLLQR
jgi:FkbM family methyltransferase